MGGGTGLTCTRWNVRQAAGLLKMLDETKVPWLSLLDECAHHHLNNGEQRSFLSHTDLYAHLSLLIPEVSTSIRDMTSYSGCSCSDDASMRSHSRVLSEHYILFSLMVSHSLLHISLVRPFLGILHPRSKT